MGMLHRVTRLVGSHSRRRYIVAIVNIRTEIDGFISRIVVIGQEALY